MPTPDENISQPLLDDMIADLLTTNELGDGRRNYREVDGVCFMDLYEDDTLDEHGMPVPTATYRVDVSLTPVTEGVTPKSPAASALLAAADEAERIRALGERRHAELTETEDHEYQYHPLTVLFALGDDSVIPGWLRGLAGRCA